jgi:hypothetical protein
MITPWGRANAYAGIGAATGDTPGCVAGRGLASDNGGGATNTGTACGGVPEPGSCSPQLPQYAAPGSTGCPH